MNLQARCDLEIGKTGWAASMTSAAERCKLTRVARRISYRDGNGEQCDQLPEGCQIRRWLALNFGSHCGTSFRKIPWAVLDLNQ